MSLPKWKRDFEHAIESKVNQRVAFNKFNPIEVFSSFIAALRNENMGFGPEAQELADELSQKYGKQIFEIWQNREK